MFLYIKDWLDKQSEVPIAFPSGLVQRLFDKGQKIGKTLKLNVNEDQPSIAITTSVYAVLDEDSDIQFDKGNKPEFWMFEDEN